jgi:hypothetical protein
MTEGNIILCTRFRNGQYDKQYKQKMPSHMIITQEQAYLLCLLVFGAYLSFVTGIFSLVQAIMPPAKFTGWKPSFANKPAA